MTDDNKALSYVGQIKTEYKAALAADGEALRHAIECGKYLSLAKENVTETKGKKGKWSTWRASNIPEISQETVSLYMRLAGAVAKDGGVFAECKSIRDAIKKMPHGTRNNNNDVEANDDAAEAENSSDATNSSRARGRVSDDLVTMLKNVGPDEIVKALKHHRPDRQSATVLASSDITWLSMGFGKMRFGEGKFGGMEQVVITTKDSDMRALSSVLQNVFDAWMRLLWQPPSPIGEY